MHHTHSHLPAPIYSGRRSSSTDNTRHHIHQPLGDPAYPRQPLRLPQEEPMYNYLQAEPHHIQSRPHSRLSAPEPIPVPFQRSLLTKHQLYGGQPRVHSPSSNSPPPSRAKSPLGYVEPLHSPRRESSPHSARGSRRKSGSGLRPMMRKSLSGSIDTQLDATAHSTMPWRGRAQVAPFQRRLSIEMPPVGWSGQVQFGSNNRLASVNKQTPADIASLMISTVSPTPSYRNELALSHGELHQVDRGGGGGDEVGGGVKSNNSIELKHEMFSNPKTSPRNHIETTTEGIQIDMLPQDESSNKTPSQKWRSSSAKYGSARHTSLGVLGHRPEMTASAKHMGDRSATFGGISALPAPPRRDLPSLDNRHGSVKVQRIFSSLLPLCSPFPSPPTPPPLPPPPLRFLLLLFLLFLLAFSSSFNKKFSLLFFGITTAVVLMELGGSL